MKEQEVSFGGEEYDHSLDCGDGLTGICIYKNLPNCILLKCAVYYMLLIPQ